MSGEIEVADRLAIVDVLSGYCRGIDRLDAGIIAASYWPDAIDDHSVFSGPATEFVPFIIKYLTDAYSMTVHRLGQSTIELGTGGGNVVAETYFDSMHRLRDSDCFESVAGRYLDRLEKRRGTWKISGRLVVIDAIREHDGGRPAIGALDSLTLGSRGTGDPSYAMFGGPRAASSGEGSRA
jgi:hypothetical protein